MSLFSGSSSDNGLPTSWPALGKGLSSQSYNDLGTSKAIKHSPTSLILLLKKSVSSASPSILSISVTYVFHDIHQIPCAHTCPAHLCKQASEVPIQMLMGQEVPGELCVTQDSHCVAPRPAASASPGNLLETKFSNLLHQNLWSGAQQSLFYPDLQVVLKHLIAKTLICWH